MKDKNQDNNGNKKKNKNQKSISIIGFGNFGKLAAKHLSKKAEVAITYDIKRSFLALFFIIN